MNSSPQNTNPMPSSNSSSIPHEDALQNAIQETAQQIVENVVENGTWQHLKQAISDTSGFKRWQRSLHLPSNANASSANTSGANSTTVNNEAINDNLVNENEVTADAISRYLRETLETLAY
jgi:hypothetical protein